MRPRMIRSCAEMAQQETCRDMSKKNGDLNKQTPQESSLMIYWERVKRQGRDLTHRHFRLSPSDLLGVHTKMVTRMV